MHISSVIKISFCRISFSGHQNKFCACLDSIYGSRVILVMCKNCSAIRWHRLNSNQSKTNCPKNLNSDGLIVREMGPWPECIFRSLLQFLVTPQFNLSHICCFKSAMAHATHITQHSGGQVGVTEYKSGSSTVSSDSNCYTNRQPLTDQHVVLAGARHSL